MSEGERGACPVCGHALRDYPVANRRGAVRAVCAVGHVWSGPAADVVAVPRRAVLRSGRFGSDLPGG